MDGYDLTEFHEKLDRNLVLFPDKRLVSENHPDIVSSPQVGNTEPGEKESLGLPPGHSSLAPMLKDLHIDERDYLHVAISKVIKKQNEVSAKRAQARQFRMALRNKRDEEGDLRADLLKSLNVATALGFSENAHSILNIAEQFRNSSDSYLGLEYDYHQLEDRLEQDDVVLEKMEQRLLSFLDRFGPQRGWKVHDEGEFQSLGEDDDSSLTSNSEYNKYPPLLFQYLSRVGDARILHERLLDLECELSEISDNKETLSRLGIALDEDSHVFLSSYGEKRSVLQRELNDIQQDVGRLKAECEANGLLSSRSLQDSRTARFYETLQEGLPKKNDPLWASELDDTCPFFEQDMSQRLSRPRFIDKWILHQLRHSSIEIFRLKSILQLVKLWNINWDETSISRWVLKLWFKDDATATQPTQTPSATGSS
jgi:hypothetical protein